MAACALIACLPAPARAAEAFLGLYAHDVPDGISLGHPVEGGLQVIGGVRSGRLEALRGIWRPQAHLLGAVNSEGGIAYAAAGLSWRIGLGGRFYLRPGIGVGVHTGVVGLADPNAPGIAAAERRRRFRAFDERLDLGSRVLFEPELALGWRASERWSVEASWVHLSHAQLAGPQNPGLGDLGVRAVYRFGR